MTLHSFEKCLSVRTSGAVIEAYPIEDNNHINGLLSMALVGFFSCLSLSGRRWLFRPHPAPCPRPTRENPGEREKRERTFESVSFLCRVGRGVAVWMHTAC